jgi:hypothetical protein
MNVRRGLFRLWIIGSVLWIAGWLWSYPFPLGPAFLCLFRITDNPYCEFRGPYTDYAEIALLGPVVALGAGLGLIWITRIQKRDKSNLDILAHSASPLSITTPYAAAPFPPPQSQGLPIHELQSHQC